MLAVTTCRWFETCWMPGARLAGRCVFIAMSTSEPSPNILRAVGAAGQKLLLGAGFTGQSGIEKALRCDLSLHAPSDYMPLNQQIHITAAYIICGLVEERLFPQRS
jgi:D-sedoheptulose 7-phosphate isomerase